MNFKYCPNCGQLGSLLPRTKTLYQCTNCQAEYWNNPKSTVAVLLIKDGQILYSKRKFAPNQGKYDFPGGFVEYNETLEAACVREVKEETGIGLKPSNLQLLTIFSEEYAAGVSVTDHIYTMTHWQGKLAASDDSAALEWHDASFMKGPSFVPFYSGLAELVQSFLANN